jgi:hypothetical protein
MASARSSNPSAAAASVAEERSAERGQRDRLSWQPLDHVAQDLNRLLATANIAERIADGEHHLWVVGSKLEDSKNDLQALLVLACVKEIERFKVH